MPEKINLKVIVGDPNIIEIKPESGFEKSILINTLNKTISGLKGFFEEITIYSFTENKKLRIEIDDVEKLENVTNKDIVELINKMIEQFNAKTFSTEEKKAKVDESIEPSSSSIPPF